MAVSIVALPQCLCCSTLSGPFFQTLWFEIGLNAETHDERATRFLRGTRVPPMMKYVIK